MKSRKAVFDRVLAFCRSEKLFSRGDHVLIALSGGKDSVTLLHALHKMRGVFSLTLSALHLHHGIRCEDADRDEGFCRALCDAYNIPLTVFHADVPSLAKEKGCGLEEAGREERYRLLWQTAESNRCTKIATAHTASDQSETLLMHLVRGSGLRGLAGIRPESNCLVRPLLCLTSEDVLLYTRENGLTFCEDKTNEDTQYFRNYIRHRVLPAMREKNPSIDRAFARFATVAAESDAYFSALADRTLQSWGYVGDGLPLVYLQEQLNTPGGLLPLEAILTRWADRTFSFEQIKDTADLITNGQEGARLSLGAGDTLVLQGERLVLNPPATDLTPINPVLLHEGMNALSGYAFSVEISSCRTGENCENISEKGYTFFLSSVTIDSLHIRPARAGDKYRALGQTKQVKKLFTDKRIQSKDRPRWPLVCDDEGIVCAPLLPQADRTVGRNIKISFLREGCTNGKQNFQSV